MNFKSPTKLLKQRNPKVLAAVVIAAILIIGIGWKIWSRVESVAVSLMPPTSEKDYLIFAEGHGQVQPGREFYLSVKKGGRLDRIAVQMGSAVEPGQLIAIIDEATNRAGLESSLSSFRLAASDHGRQQKLYAAHATTAQDLDQSRSTQVVRRAELEQAKQRLEDSMVRANAKGILTHFAFKVGDYIPDGARVAIIEDRASYRIVTSIAAEYRKSLPPKASIELAALDPQTMEVAAKATVEATLRLANPASNYDGMEVDVLAEFTSLPPSLSSGGSMRVRIPVEKIPEVAIVPARAVIWRDERPRIIAREANGKLKWVDVSVVTVDGDRAVLRPIPGELTPIEPTRLSDLEKAISRATTTKIAQDVRKGSKS